MPVPNPYWASQAPVEEDSRGVRRGRRGVLAEGYWKGGMELFSATAFVCRIHISPSPQKKRGSEPCPLGIPMARSKTPPRPLREALRIRMERSGWEGGFLFGRAQPPEPSQHSRVPPPWNHRLLLTSPRGLSRHPAAYTHHRPSSRGQRPQPFSPPRGVTKVKIVHILFLFTCSPYCPCYSGRPT